MHEASLIRGLVAQIERVALNSAATKIVSVDLWMGALAQMSPDHLKEHFVEAAREGVAEGAELIIDQSDDVQHPQAQQIILKSVEALDRGIIA